jgi:hypothetical protein
MRWSVHVGTRAVPVAYVHVHIYDILIYLRQGIFFTIPPLLPWTARILFCWLLILISPGAGMRPAMYTGNTGIVVIKCAPGIRFFRGQPECALSDVRTRHTCEQCAKDGGRHRILRKVTGFVRPW